jgi:hypothetical protein
MLIGGWFAQLIYSAAISHAYLYDTVVIFVIFWFTGSMGYFSGSIIGFLFGIPKTSSLNSGENRGSGSGRYRVNANIEEISDWLTKIIVGLTLVNIRTIVSFIGDVGQAVSAATIPTQHDHGANPGAAIIAIASLFYGFACGFLRFYFWSRDLQYEYERFEWMATSNQPPDEPSRVGP